MSVKFTCEVTREGRDKTKMLKSIPRAHQYQLERWGAKTTRALKIRGGGGVLKTRSGHLRRNVGMRLHTLAHIYRLTVGTGSGVMLEKVKYADILDRGGTIRPRVKQYLTIPLGKTKGWARNFKNTFIQKSKAGNLIIFQKIGKKKIKPLFLLKKSVKIPAFKWFANTIKKMRPDLTRALSKREILKVAKRI